MTEAVYSIVERDDLADALRGDARFRNNGWPSGRHLPRLRDRQVILVWADKSSKPSALIVTDEDRSELFAWAATFHSDLTPLSSWCQIISSTEFERRPIGEAIAPEFFGMEAAWAGIMLAEAMELSGRSYDGLSLNALLATESFAMGRAAGLYGAKTALAAIPERLEKVRRQLRPKEQRDRAATAVMEILIGLMPDAPRSVTGNNRILLNICAQLLANYESNSERFLERAELRELIDVAPILEPLSILAQMPAEERVRYLRFLQDRILSSPIDDRPLIAFGAGYVISRIGSAERDLRLADGFADSRAAVLCWATVTGSLGATTYWTDAFAGLGRFAARELVRPMHPLDPPNWDLSFDEVHLMDERSAKPKYRTANRSVVAVSLLPGVTMHFGTSEPERSTISRATEARQAPATMLDLTQSQLEDLAESLLPILRSRLQVGQTKGRRSTRSPQLPFGGKS